MVYKIFLIAWMCGMNMTGAYCQLRLPAFDVSLKGNYLSLNDEYQYATGSRGFMYESLGLQGEIHLQLSQRLAVGWVYGKSMFISNYHDTWGSNGDYDRSAEHLFYGANLRLSGGRSSKLRPYVQAKYFWLEVTVTHPDYRAAADMKGFAGGVGLMLRLNNKLYINLIEGEACVLKPHGSRMFRANDIFPQFRTGLTYNFSKRK